MGCGQSQEAEVMHTHSPTTKGPTATTVIASSKAIKMIKAPITKHYKIVKPRLGLGAYSAVFTGVEKEYNQQYAIRMIPKSHFASDDEAQAKITKEIEILSLLDHINVVRLHELYEDDAHYNYVMELCRGGLLFDTLLNTAGGFSEKTVAMIMRQLLSAVTYLHENHIAHRDLRPETLMLLTKEPLDSGSATLKLISFDRATVFEEGKAMTDLVGAPYYIAPEVLGRRYNEKCDVWSCGVIMYLLLCGDPPFNGANDAEILNKVRKQTFSMSSREWDSVSSQAKDLVSKLLTGDPNKRISALEALNHPWVSAAGSGGAAAAAAKDTMISTAQIENLKSFCNQNRLKQEALQIIAQNLPASEVAALKKLFQSLDKNGDGRLSLEEVKQAIEARMKVNRRQSKRAGIVGSPATQEPAAGAGDAESADVAYLTLLLQNLDMNGSGSVEYSEFLAAVATKAEFLRDQQLWAAFKQYDVDGNGYISRSELRQMLAASNTNVEDKTTKKNATTTSSNNSGADDDVATLVSPADIERIMKECDEDGDGHISFEEFVKMMSS